jgi:putative tryptophan/tyrosine transport system substrate-binding protein
MRRREFITLTGVAAAAWPLAVRAQQPVMPRIAVLVPFPEGDPQGEEQTQALVKGLSEFGWKRDKNIQIDMRWAGSDPARMQKLAKELVEKRPDLIQVTSTPATAAVLRETHSIPVVFSVVSDPLGSGFVESFTRPGGNATGFGVLEDSVAGKWLELLKELAPLASWVSIPFNPETAPQSGYYLKLLEAAAPSLALELKAVQVSNDGEIEAEIAHLAQRSNVGLVVIPDLFTALQAQREMIIALTARHRLPAVYNDARFVRAGGLVSYGVDLPDLLRRAAGYIDRILKGAKPQDLPVQLPTKFELVINLKTAKALGLTVIARPHQRLRLTKLVLAGP